MKSSPALPTGPRRARRGRFAALGLVVLAAGALSGCQVDNTPKAYDDQVRTNYQATCTGQLPNVSTTTVIATSEQCTCSYDVFQANVPYNADDRTNRLSGYPADKPVFHDLESQLASEPGKYNDLPQDVRDKIEACKSKGAVGPVAPGSTAPGTTAPGTTAPGTTSTTAAP